MPEPTETNIDFLPQWKKGATAEEWFMEVAHVARKYPDRFAKIVMTMISEDREVRVYAHGCLNSAEEIGIAEIGKAHAMQGCLTHR